MHTPINTMLCVHLTSMKGRYYMSTELENLVKQDPEFSESKFKSKVENEFVQIKLSIVTGKTERIKHFVNEETYNKITKKVEEDIANNRIQMYDELNVANVQLLNIEELDDCFQIKVQVHSKALEYYISRDTRKFLSGNNSYRTERDSMITFKKIKNNKELGVARKCPSCGATLDINRSGKCEYCGAIFSLENYDWTIVEMDI